MPGVGTIRADEPWLGALVLNVTFLFSTFVFAILLGLISEDVKGHIKAMRSGGFKHTCVMHTSMRQAELFRYVSQI